MPYRVSTFPALLVLTDVTKDFLGCVMKSSLQITYCQLTWTARKQDCATGGRLQTVYSAAQNILKGSGLDVLKHSSFIGLDWAGQHFRRFFFFMSSLLS